MMISESKLRKIIREEAYRTLREQAADDPGVSNSPSGAKVEQLSALVDRFAQGAMQKGMASTGMQSQNFQGGVSGSSVRSTLIDVLKDPKRKAAVAKLVTGGKGALAPGNSSSASPVSKSYAAWMCIAGVFEYGPNFYDAAAIRALFPEFSANSAAAAKTTYDKTAVAIMQSGDAGLADQIVSTFMDLFM